MGSENGLTRLAGRNPAAGLLNLLLRRQRPVEPGGGLSFGSFANFAWVQHFIHHLAPTGLAGFVLANGSMSSNQSGEGEIRKAIIDADLVDCMIALPGQLFYSTQIPVCLWFLTRTKHGLTRTWRDFAGAPHWRKSESTTTS